MFSPEKEYVEFNKSIDVNDGERKGNVEVWLLDIEVQMRESLRDLSKKTMMDEDTPRNIWVTKYNSQVVLAANMIRWTTGAEQAFTKIKQDANAM